MRSVLILLSLLSGLLLSLPWLGGSGFVLWFALVPVFFLENYFTRNKSTFTSLTFWYYAFGIMLFWNAFTTWWIWHATPAGAIFAIVTNSFLMSLVWLLFHFAHRTKNSGFAVIFLIAAWLSFEYLHFNWEMAWPWLTLGNGFANDVKLIQWYEFTGVMGGSLWVLISNFFIWQLVKSYLYHVRGSFLGRVLLLLIVILVPVTYSLARFCSYNENEAPVKVAVVQPNIDPYNEKFDEMPFHEQYKRMLDLSATVADRGVDFYIGPETALHNVNQNWVDNELGIRMIKQFLTENDKDAAFITGAMTYRYYNQMEDATPTARYNADSSMIFDAYNSALMLKTNKPVEMYHKSKLVAGVEQIPFERYLGFLDNLVIDLGGTTGSLATDSATVVFEHEGIHFGVPICYESVFGNYLSGFVRNGAEVLFVITNDGWWKNSPGYLQHFSFARLQAVSLRRSIARTANTGISGFINQRGEVITKTQWWVSGVETATLNRNKTLTFYAKTGDFIARVSLFMFVLMLLNLFVASFKMKNDSIV